MYSGVLLVQYSTRVVLEYCSRAGRSSLVKVVVPPTFSSTGAAHSERLQRAAGDQDCVICLEALCAHPVLRLANCGHNLHLHCYLAFTAHDSARGAATCCPLCRASLIVEQQTEGTGVIAAQTLPPRCPDQCSDAHPNAMAKALLRWAREQWERGGQAETVPATHRGREERVRALETAAGLSNDTSESLRTWRHAASHASLLAGPGEHPAAALHSVATDARLQREAQHRVERDGMGRSLERRTRERQADLQALWASQKRREINQQKEQQEAREERQRLREQIAADRRARTSL